MVFLLKQLSSKWKTDFAGQDSFLLHFVANVMNSMNCLQSLQLLVLSPN